MARSYSAAYGLLMTRRRRAHVAVGVQLFRALTYPVPLALGVLSWLVWSHGVARRLDPPCDQCRLGESTGGRPDRVQPPVV